MIFRGKKHITIEIHVYFTDLNGKITYKSLNQVIVSEKCTVIYSFVEIYTLFTCSYK